MPAPEPEDLRALGARLDQARRRKDDGGGGQKGPPAMSSIAFRFATELVAALIVGGGLGWLLDWAFGKWGFHTKPVLLIVMFVLGAAAGIRNVMRAAKEINEEIAAAPKAPSVDDEEK